MVLRVTEMLVAIGLLVTLAWTISAPSFEPIAAFLTTLVAVVGVESRRRSTFRLGSTKLLEALRGRRSRRTGIETTIRFDLAFHGQSEHHQVDVVRHSAGGEEVYRVSLRHTKPDGTVKWLGEIEGHVFTLEAVDIDSDNISELLVRWHTGAHTHVIKIFRYAEGDLREIVGSEVGSDWPEILLEDRDHDGILEICAKQRRSISEWVEERHVLRDATYRRVQ